MSELDEFSAPVTAPQTQANPLDEFSAPVSRPTAQQRGVVQANDNSEEAAAARAVA